MSVIKANPFEFKLDPENPPALIIIDMQNDFLVEGGFGSTLGNDVTPVRVIIPTVQKILAVFRKFDLPIIHTKEAHKVDLSDCPAAKRNRGNPELSIGDSGPMGRILIDGEFGSSIISELTPLAGEFVITKPGKGAFYNTRLSQVLNDIGCQSLILAGVTTEVCVQTTMREANDRGFDCLLVEDATDSYFPEFKKMTLQMITAQNAIVGWTAKCDDVLHVLAETYGE